MKKIISVFLVVMMGISDICLSVSAREGDKYVYRNNTFDYNFAPEAMHVTDEDFFGQWDSVKGEWILEPDLNYDRFPALSDVENAAKEGNYAAAKVAIKAYYLPQKSSKVSKLKATDAAILEAEMSQRNIHAVRTIGDVIGFVQGADTQWKELSSTAVLPFVQTAASQNNPYITFAVASVDKSNTPAEIKSRNTDNPPTLTIMADGAEMTLTACEDTYISPCLNADTNYGTEEILYAQEYGYTSHWSDPTAPWGDEASATRRTLIKFDISKLSSKSDISSATFKFTTRVSSGGDLTEKELFLYGWNDSTWDEGEVTWNSYTDWLFFSCNDQDSWTYRMSSKTTEKGKMCFYHRGSQPANVARMYSATGDEKYAHSFLRHMSHLLYYVGVSSDYMNALDMSNHIANVGEPFIHCWDSEYMTPELFTSFLKHFSRMTDFIIVNYLDKDSHWNNWASNQTGSTYWACMMFPEFAHADYWYEKTLFHNKKLFKNFTFEDGVCIEQGLGYIGTILGTINRAIDVYNQFSENPPYGIFMDEDGTNMILNIVKNMYFSTAPGYGGFDLSDSMDYGKSYKSSITSWYKKLVKLGIDDEELKYVATSGAQGKLPDFTSISYPYANRTYMRTSWEPDAIAMAVTAKGGNASHRHKDIMSVSMYAYGQYLLIDSSYGAVLTGDVYNYMSAPQRHNTLTINGGSLKNGASQDSVTKEVEISHNYNYVTYSNAYFDNATNVERSVMFPKNEKFFIITDYVVPKTQTEVNTVEQYWHMLPSADIKVSDDGKNELRSNFETGANVIVAPVDSASFTSVSLDESLYAPASGTFIENKRGTFVKETYGPTSFGTIIYPLMEGEDKIIDTTPIDTRIADNGAVAFKINITDTKTEEVQTYYYYHLNDLYKRKAVSIGSYKTDASTFLVKEDALGNVLWFFVYDGSYVEKSDINDAYLYYGSGQGRALGVDYNGATVEISSDDITEESIKNISLYGGSCNNVTLNGKAVNSTKEGSALYFGGNIIVKPMVDDDVTIIKWDENSTIGDSGSIFATHIDKVYSKYTSGSQLSPVSSYSGSGRNATTETDADGTKYISTLYGGYKHNCYSGNDATKRGELFTYTNTHVPVISLKAVMRIPKGENLTTTREVYINFTEGKKVSLYCKQLEDENGNTYLGVTTGYEGNTTDVATLPFAYTPGDWVTIELRMLRNTDGTLTLGGYAEGKQIYYAKTTDELFTTSMGIHTLGIYNGKTKGAAVDYKEISVSARDEIYKPINEIITDNEKRIMFYDFQNVDYKTPSAKSIISSSVGDFEGLLKIDTKSYFANNVSYKTEDFQIPSKQNNSLFVSVNGDGDEAHSLRLVQEGSVALNNYIDPQGETVFKVHYDVYIPSGSEGSARSSSVKLNDSFTLNSLIKNGKLTFSVNNACAEVQPLPLAYRSESASLSADVWHRVEFVLKINSTENGFEVKIYGILDGKCSFEDGYEFKTDDITVSEFPEISIFGTGTGLSVIKTGYDNIGLCKMSDYTDSFTNGFSESTYIYPLHISCAEGVAQAKARLTGYDKACLVLTVYNADGTVNKVYTSSEFKGEYLACTSKLSDVNIQNGYKVKAFLFDSLATAVPYVEDVAIEIK